MRCTTGRPSLRGRAPGSPSRSTSRSSTTDGACTRPWATAPHTTRSPTTELRQPPQRDQPEDLSKILDTAQRHLQVPLQPCVTGELQVAVEKYGQLPVVLIAAVRAALDVDVPPGGVDLL